MKISCAGRIIDWARLCTFIALATGSATAEDVLVDRGDVWKFFRGTRAPSDPPTAWRQPNFDDSAWETGPSGIGYGDDDDATVLDDMPLNYLSVYLRRELSIANADALESATLEIDYDDGFIAFVNGAEAARGGMGTPGQEFRFDAPAPEEHEAGVPERFEIDLGLLQTGVNVIAIEGHNVASKSSDFSLIPRILAEVDAPPAFRRGDVNGDRETNITDAIGTLRTIFLDPRPFACPDAADADDNGKVEPSDAIHLLTVLFLGEGAIPPPGRIHCGADTTADKLGDCAYPACPDPGSR